MVKATVGKGDAVASLTAKISENRARTAAAEVSIDRLTAESEAAENFEAARATEERITRLRWDVRTLVRALPELEAELAAARSEKQNAAIVKHQIAAAALWAKLKKAVETAAALQAEAITARNAAEAEIGGNAAAQYLPVVVYRGFVLPEFVSIWAAETDRVVAAMQPPAAAHLRIAPKTAPPAFGPGAIGVGDLDRIGGRTADRTAVLVRKPPPDPVLRAAPSPPSQPVAGYVEMVVSRGGYTTPDGFQRSRGEHIFLPAETAKIAAGNGAIEFVTRGTPDA